MKNSQCIVYLSLNNIDVAEAVLCDVTKAFDCVDHGILVVNSNFYGFRGVSLKWLSPYVSHRAQPVVLQNETSQVRPITSDVPQGSLMGPLLYLMYVNESNSLPNIEISLEQSI